MTTPPLDVAPIGALQLALSALLLVIPGALSAALRLGLVRQIAVAGARCVIQLSLVGLVLDWVFAQQSWATVLAMLCVMVGAASRAAVSRLKRGYAGATWGALLALIITTAAVMGPVTTLVLDIEPWYRAQYVIPMAGMLLGNSLTGLSLTLDRLLDELVVQRPAIEARLAMGATLREATLPHVREAMRAGMIPILNSMSVVGIVSLPGMMTGQILSGTDPQRAVAYQILIMFMMAGSTALATMVWTRLTLRALTHPDARLDWDKITRRAQR